MRTIAGILLMLLLSGCEGVPASSAQPANTRVYIPFTPDVSINEVMVGQIDHAAHFIWNAADPGRPATEVDWQEVEHHAIQLIGSRSALSMGGTGVNDAMWIAQQPWRDYVDAMNRASLLALTSARSSNRAGLARAGDDLIATCEGCHQQFKPSIPTEGMMHPH